MNVGRSFWTKDMLSYILLYKDKWITQDCILLEHAKTEFFQHLQSYLWLVIVNIESFTCNTFRGIHIQIIQGLTDKSLLDFLQREKNWFSSLKPMVNITNAAIFITFFTDGKNQLNFAHVHKDASYHWS